MRSFIHRDVRGVALAAMRRTARATLLAASGLFLVAGTNVHAQSGDMSCADYLKADAEAMAALSPSDKAMLQADPQAAAVDAKMRAYCKANPKASSSEAAMKAMQ